MVRPWRWFVVSIGRVAIIGGGVAGLAAALALDDHAREVIVIERDPPPPEIAPLAAFEAWPRPGVPQFRHAHILLARLRTILRDRHPKLLAELLDAGLELSQLSDSIPSAHLPRFAARPDDDDLLHLWGRRATFEYVLRRHVERLPHVRFIHGAKVEDLRCERDGRALRVRGVELTRNGSREVLEADLVVDASGKASKAPEWLEKQGVRVKRESHPSGFVYACRHFRLKKPLAPPPRREGGGNLDYLGYATFWAERGYFAVAFGCATEEQVLADALRRPEGFSALCSRIPLLAEWTRESEVASKVFGAGRFENRWTSYRVRGGLELCDFFAVGDSLLETNPMYGRGCSSAFVQAQLLAETLGAHEDPGARARHYDRRTRALLRPYFQFSINTDRIYRIRASLSRGLRVAFADRVFNHLYEAGFQAANEGSLLVAREFVKAQQMREISSVGVRLLLGLHLLYALFRSWFGRRKAPPHALGPAREKLLASLAETAAPMAESAE